MNEDIRKRFLINNDDTGRFLVTSTKTGKTYFVEAIDSDELTKWVEAKEFDRNEKVAAVTNLYNEIGIRQLCEQKIEQYYQESLVYLDKVSVSDERKAEIKAYAAEMMKRQS